MAGELNEWWYDSIWDGQCLKQECSNWQTDTLINRQMKTIPDRLFNCQCMRILETDEWYADIEASRLTDKCKLYLTDF